MTIGNIHAGFTGTQSGMTGLQIEAITEFLYWPVYFTAHHGDCVGADADFHFILRNRGRVWITGHPPKNPAKRAWCDFDEVYPEEEYLVRNKIIVDKSDWMIVCPRGEEEELRSGTWSTYRYAIKQGKRCYVFYPDGRMEIK